MPTITKIPEKKKLKKPLVRHSHENFDFIILEATEGMPRYKQVFSRFIHLRMTSVVSEAIGTTIMRPNALLFGAIASFALTICAYLLSKNLGYSLSGSESMIFFAIGWAIGIVFDIASHLLRKH